MTRKDYRNIAAELSLSRPQRYPDYHMGNKSSEGYSNGFALAVEAVARALASDNYRFDAERFYSAVYDD